MLVPPGDVTTMVIIILAIQLCLFADGVFIFNLIYSSKLHRQDCPKDQMCASTNLLSNMPPPANCTAMQKDCVTKGFYGGFVNGCCVKGKGEQHMDPISILIVVSGFIIVLVGSGFLYIKYTELKERKYGYEVIGAGIEKKNYETIN